MPDNSLMSGNPHDKNGSGPNGKSEKLFHKEDLNEINEGQISITELNPTDQKQIKQLENILDGKLDTIYTGGSQDGRFVASIKLSNNYSIYKFTPVVMKNILKFNIKYVTGGHGLVNIAFN
jgi:ubiquitin-protein ligase